MSNETYIAAYALAGGIATAHSESAWDALLRGDLDFALAATPRYIDLRTGREADRRVTERAFAATASAGRKPSTAVERMDALAAQIYGGEGPWGSGRRS